MKQFTGKLPLNLVDDAEKKYTVKLAAQTGGKAGKGNNKTSTVQVIYQDVMMTKQVRYKINDMLSMITAIEKAISYAIGTKEAKKYFTNNTQ